MSSRARLLIGVACGLLVFSGTGVALAWAAVSYAEPVSLEVVESGDDGSRVSLHMPAVVLDVALEFVPSPVWHDASEEIRPWAPTIRAAADALARCPDAVFVEVTGPDEHVRIAKRGGSLRIEVESPDAHVRIALPIRTIRAAIRKLVSADGAPRASL